MDSAEQAAPPPVSPFAPGLEALSDRIRAVFAAKHAARERALTSCRDVIRHASMAIRAIHRDEVDAAHDLLAAGRALLDQIHDALAEHPDLFHAGYVHDAQKEHVEAAITVALILDRPAPAPEDLGVEYAAYLNGLGEVVGELRRYLLNGLRHGDLSRSERLLAAMDDIYSLLVTVDYPDAITGGLRRTTDVARGILEKTRGDLTIAARQEQLELRLQRYQSALVADRAAHAPL